MYHMKWSNSIYSSLTTHLECPHLLFLFFYSHLILQENLEGKTRQGVTIQLHLTMEKIPGHLGRDGLCKSACYQRAKKRREFPNTGFILHAALLNKIKSSRLYFKIILLANKVCFAFKGVSSSLVVPQIHRQPF